MRVSKIVCALCIILLNSCITIGRSGFYIPEPESYFINNLIKIPINFIKENIFICSNNEPSYIYLMLPQRIDNNSNSAELLFFPTIINSKCGNSCISIEQIFTIKLGAIDKCKYTKDFLKNLSIYVVKNEKIYQSSQEDYGKLDFFFPFKIKDFKEGIIVISYKNYKKEIPIKYEKRFYNYTNHQ